MGWPCMECHVPCHISICWVWDSVKQSEGWGKNPALIARSPTRHSKLFIEKFHHKSSLLVWLPKPAWGLSSSCMLASDPGRQRTLALRKTCSTRGGTSPPKSRARPQIQAEHKSKVKMIRDSLSIQQSMSINGGCS